MRSKKLSVAAGLIVGTASLVAWLAAHEDPPEDNSGQFESAWLAGAIDITPESLAVSGLGATDGDAMLIRIAEATEFQESIASAQQTADEQADRIADLVQILAADATNSQAQSDLMLARSLEATAVNAIAESLSDLQAVVLDGYAPAVRDAVEACSETATFRLTAELRVTEASTPEIVNLERACTIETRAARLDEELDAEVASLLAVERADPIVVDAKEGLVENLADLEEVFAEDGG